MEKAEGKYEVAIEVKGKILGVRQVTNRGRVQIPRVVRDQLKVREGDRVYWVELEERIYITKAVKIP